MTASLYGRPLVKQKSLMALSLSLGKYLLAFMEAREDRHAVYIGVFFPLHGVK